MKRIPRTKQLQQLAVDDETRLFETCKNIIFIEKLILDIVTSTIMIEYFVFQLVQVTEKVEPDLIVTKKIELKKFRLRFYVDSFIKSVSNTSLCNDQSWFNPHFDIV